MNLQLNPSRKDLLRRGWIRLAIMLGALSLLTSSSPAQTYLPSTSDLWDISQGTVVTATSGMNSAGADARDMFGGQFSSVETGVTDFADGRPPGFVHYTQWQTTAPVTVSSFVLFAQGDGPTGQFPSQREFAQFVLKAKSSPSATNYDLTLYTLVVTNHPYNYVDAVNHALVAANITPVTAQYFRAEFTQYNAGNGFDGPRIVELDGFGPGLPTCDPPPSGLVSWWQGEGDVGDAAGTNNGTIQGGLTFAGGEVSQAFQFNGTSGYAVVPASTSLDVGQGPGMTIECWIKPADALLRPIAEWNSGSSYGTVFWINQPLPFGTGTGSLYSTVVDASGQGHSVSSAAGLIVPNVFQHVALTYDRASGVAALYCNGAMVAQQYIGSFALQTSYPLYFGYRPWGEDAGTLFNGQMDEIGLYNRALSQTELQAIYNAGGAGKCGLALGVVMVQPQTQTVNSGGNATFTAVVSSGSRPLAYQWSAGGAPLTGATNSSLTLNNVQVTNGGNYSVQVSNIYGSTNSSLAVLTVIPPPPPILPSTNDLWDVSQGAVVTATSGIHSPFSDARDMFGGTFSPSEPGNTVFADGQPAGFVHYTQWQTLGPVTVTNFVLFASGDGPTGQFPTQREFAQFVLKAKSSPSATNYDLTLYTLVVTNHPYVYLDPVNKAVVAANITPVTAQYFRAEFTQYNAGNNHDGPRVLELDGFGPNPPVVISGPTNTETFAGTSTTFSVAVEGSAPLSYQWQENSTNIPAAVNPTATNATLVLTNVQADQYGYAYSVLVTNVYGSTNSSNALLTVLGPGSCFPPAVGLVSWWPGEHTAIDIAGTNKGTLMGGVTFTNGEVGQAFNFNGINQYVDVPNSASLNPTHTLTVEAWIYPRQFPNFAPIIKKGGEGLATQDGYSCEIDSTGGALIFWVYAGGGVGWVGSTPAMVSLNQWSHVAGVYDGTNISLYLNGSPVGAPVFVGGSIVPSGNDLNIGHDPSIPSRFFNGLIDEATVYNNALTAAQIQDIYLAGSAGKCSEPVIIGQPQSQVDYYGSSIVLSVNAGGSGTLSYQWLDNGVAIENATNSTLMLNNLQFANAGAYSVVISNAYGVTTSAPAFLTVNPAGVSIALYSGVTITGVPGLTYGIQYNTDLSNSNGWLGLTNVTLIGTNALSFDLQPATLSRRYYRVVPGPISIP